LTAVSLVRGKNLRTGCDIEQIRPRAKAAEIADKFFSSSEKNYLFSGGTFDQTRFHQIWTLKECFLKLRGFSVLDMQKAPSFIDDEGHFAFDEAVSSPISFYVYELKDLALALIDETYLLAVAIEGTKQHRPDLRWFSQSFLSTRSIVEIKAAPSPTRTVSPKM
jgi:phosphopantetheinyl transferase